MTKKDFLKISLEEGGFYYLSFEDYIDVDELPEDLAQKWIEFKETREKLDKLENDLYEILGE